MGIRERLNFQNYRRLFLSFIYRFNVPDYDGMMNENKCRFLYKLVDSHQGSKTNIVEIGSWKGCSTTWLAMAGKRNNFQSLIAIDLFTGTPSWKQDVDTYEIFWERMKKNSLTDFVEPIRENSAEVAKQWPSDKKIAILHIDGDHSYEAAKADIEHYMPFLEADGIVIVDDYDSMHPGVLKAVDELLKTKQFSILDKVDEIPQKGFGSIALNYPKLN